MTPNPTTVAYMEGVSSATNVTLYGNGYEAVALGVRLEVRGDLAVQELLDGGAEGLVVLVIDGALHAGDCTAR